MVVLFLQYSTLIFTQTENLRYRQVSATFFRQYATEWRLVVDFLLNLPLESGLAFVVNRQIWRRDENRVYRPCTGLLGVSRPAGGHRKHREQCHLPAFAQSDQSQTRHPDWKPKGKKKSTPHFKSGARSTFHFYHQTHPVVKGVFRIGVNVRLWTYPSGQWSLAASTPAQLRNCGRWFFLVGWIFFLHSWWTTLLGVTWLLDLLKGRSKLYLDISQKKEQIRSTNR